MPLRSNDYREFLERALQRRGASRRELAAAIRRSESWVSYLMSGQRSIDPALIGAISAALRLSSEEETFFAALIDLEGPSDRARRLARAAIDGIRRQRAVEDRGREQVRVFSRWYVPATLELARCEDFRADPHWIANTLQPPIAPDQAREALEVLAALGLLVERDGRLQPTGPECWSPSELPPGEASEAAVDLHQAGLRLAAEALRAHRQNERHVSSAFLALTEEQYPRLAARLREVERELLLMASEPGSGDPNRVYIFGFNLFPVSDYTDSGEAP